MKVVLLQDVKDLGVTGEVKEVSEGYYRNYLARHGYASAATESAMKKLREQKSIESRREARQAQQSRTNAEKIAQVRISFKVKVGEQHRLFGSVTSADVAEALSKEIGFEIDKRSVDLEDPIRHLGTYEVPVNLAHGISPKLTVIVEPAGEE